MKKIIILSLIVFASFKANSQDSESLVVINKNKPELKPREIVYLIERGVPDSYKWDNGDINSMINIGLKKRKTANILLFGTLGTFAIGLIYQIALNANANNFVSQASTGNFSAAKNSLVNAFDSYTVAIVFYSISTALLIPTIIYSSGASKTIKAAGYKLNNR